ncbi:uncharacterized protein LOC143037422 isoform X2 [Oratosquilla oratoria]|uniref:uncharacterized protein LOC143037422 isoform X2 n=1 Tax=Oratosquilla oratoria TaxID=337810 RepID=UPI003F769C3C
MGGECYVCNSDLGNQGVPGTMPTKYSNSSVLTTVVCLLQSDQTQQVVVSQIFDESKGHHVCLRCYHLVVGIDYHRHHFELLVQELTQYARRQQKKDTSKELFVQDSISEVEKSEKSLGTDRIQLNYQQKGNEILSVDCLEELSLDDDITCDERSPFLMDSQQLEFYRRHKKIEAKDGRLLEEQDIFGSSNVLSNSCEENLPKEHLELELNGITGSISRNLEDLEYKDNLDDLEHKANTSTCEESPTKQYVELQLHAVTGSNNKTPEDSQCKDQLVNSDCKLSTCKEPSSEQHQELQLNTIRGGNIKNLEDSNYKNKLNDSEYKTDIVSSPKMQGEVNAEEGEKTEVPNIESEAFKVSDTNTGRRKRHKKAKILDDYVYDSVNPTQNCDNELSYNEEKTMAGKGNPKQYRCFHCKEDFTKRQLYVKHTQKCYKNIAVECNMCKGFLCEMCGKDYSRKEALERHMARIHHISHGQYQCNLCGSVFAHTSLLAEHMRAHRGYKCKECGSKFSCSSNLRLHIRAHHKHEAPYYCAACNKRWKFHASYVYHRNKVHRNSKYPCQVCQELFSSETDLAEHRLTCEKQNLEITICRPGQIKSSSHPDTGTSHDIATPSPLQLFTVNENKPDFGLELEKGSCNGSKTMKECETNRSSCKTVQSSVRGASMKFIKSSSLDILLGTGDTKISNRKVRPPKDKNASPTASTDEVSMEYVGSCSNQSENDIILEAQDELGGEFHYIILVEEHTDDDPVEDHLIEGSIT